MQSHCNSEAGSYETRGEVISVQQDSTRNLIQFSIALSIKTWNCFPEFSGPFTAQATLVTATIANSRFDNLGGWFIFRFRAMLFFSYFFGYVVNLLSSSREQQQQGVTEPLQ